MKQSEALPDDEVIDPVLQEVPFWKDANIGMENVSPYDFMDEE
ncbi:hypothetical protein [Bacillus sp. m3-13]|nr:hypothetical protein [Bacillus sp. m3-13]